MLEIRAILVRAVKCTATLQLGSTQDCVIATLDDLDEILRQLGVDPATAILPNVIVGLQI
jgi:hypothetical protein